MANIQFFSPIDLTSDEEWNWEVTVLNSTQISVAGPVYAATFIGNFVIGATSVTGTLHEAHQYKNGALQLSATGLSVDAQTMADLVENYSAEATYAYILQGNDTQTGSSSADLLGGFGGNDAIDGGGGTDTAYYSGLLSSYTVTKTATGFTVTDSHGIEGTDTLVNVERLQFQDKYMALDVLGNGGMAYRLYQAAFNRTPDIGGLGYQMNALDQGLNIAQVAQNFINSPEFSATYGALNDTQFVTQLYANVLHRAPDDGGLAYHTGNLASGANTRANVLVGFSESPENQAALIGTIQNGMVFTL
jgi:Ca2+-binding RTX toxin-like protein